MNQSDAEIELPFCMVPSTDPPLPGHVFSPPGLVFSPPILTNDTEVIFTKAENGWSMRFRLKSYVAAKLSTLLDIVEKDLDPQNKSAKKKK